MANQRRPCSDHVIGLDRAEPISLLSSGTLVSAEGAVVFGESSGDGDADGVQLPFPRSRGWIPGSVPGDSVPVKGGLSGATGDRRRPPPGEPALKVWSADPRQDPQRAPLRSAASCMRALALDSRAFDWRGALRVRNRQSGFRTAERPSELPGRPEREREGPIRSRRAQERRAGVTGWGGGCSGWLLAAAAAAHPGRPAASLSPGLGAVLGVAGRQVADPSFGRDWFRIPCPPAESAGPARQAGFAAAPPARAGPASSTMKGTRAISSALECSPAGVDLSLTGLPLPVSWRPGSATTTKPIVRSVSVVTGSEQKRKALEATGPGGSRAINNLRRSNSTTQANGAHRLPDAL
ncbi:uncharacterized protein LOC115833629 [Nomascus leucogenys]|uniref:uncharacterized protein LOC115833629 n=1 Tax=Nomascus leucogenys TaxID=61853 RepID=UPI00122D54E6|nr:uncharacterized protein LOC115833629 [Nomascus leucogenys]